MTPRPFTIEADDARLEDLRSRLRATRLPRELPGGGWAYGMDIGLARELLHHWLHDYDWAGEQAALNSFSHFKAEIEGVDVHFVHERGSGTSPLPIVLTHGWPGSFVEMLELVPRLAHPERFGGDAEEAFDVVVPSLPGFGFSDPFDRVERWARTPDVLAALMSDVLGYRRFGAHGGDIGGGITAALGMRYPDRVAGIHLTTDWPVLEGSAARSEREQKVEDDWDAFEGAYGEMQGTKPHTLGCALNDSPLGLAAWIVEKWQAWSDCGGDVRNSFTFDQLLTNVMVYWLTETITTSFVPYFHSRHNDKPRRWHRIEVPTGIAIPPGSAPWPPPRHAAEATYDLVRWTELPRGGHFAALEIPDLLAAELRAFFAPLR